MITIYKPKKADVLHKQPFKSKNNRKLTNGRMANNKLIQSVPCYIKNDNGKIELKFKYIEHLG